jgi:hypothetical protein
MDIRDNPNYYFTDRPYKPKLVCSDCRKVFKRRLAIDIAIHKTDDQNNVICPHCGKMANYIGPKFRAPKSENIKAWNAIKVLNEIGVLNFMGFTTNRIVIPESSKGLHDLLSEMRVDYERSINQWVSYEYSDENKLHIKTFSEIIKRIDKYLSK